MAFFALPLVAVRWRTSVRAVPPDLSTARSWRMAALAAVILVVGLGFALQAVGALATDAPMTLLLIGTCVGTLLAVRSESRTRARVVAEGRMPLRLPPPPPLLFAGIPAPLPTEDPGWGRAIRRAAIVAFVPGLAHTFARRSPTPDGLSALRTIFVIFGVSALWYGVMVAIATSWSTRVPMIPVLVPLLIGFAVNAMIWILNRRPLPVDREAFVARWKSRMFVGLALAQVPALAGGIGALLSRSPLPYAVGLLPAALGYAWVAPTRRNLERQRRQLLDQGSVLEPSLALIDATPFAPVPPVPPARPDGVMSPAAIRRSRLLHRTRRRLAASE